LEQVLIQNVSFRGGKDFLTDVAKTTELIRLQSYASLTKSQGITKT